MERNCVLVVAFFMALVIIVDSSRANLEVEATPNTGLDAKGSVTSNETNNSNERTGGSNSVLDSMKVDPVKKDKDQVGGLKEGVQSILDKSNSSKQLETKEGHKVQTNKGGSSKELRVKEGDKKGKLGEGLKSKEVPKVGKEQSGQGLGSKEVPNDGGNEGISASLNQVRKESSWGEECDSSNKCTDEENKLVACLRVPGNESPDLSLLIQNRGKGPLTVTISAPDFVQLEKTKVELQDKDDTEVKVSIRNGGADNLIILTAGSSRCSLDFRELLAHNSRKETDDTPKSTYINFLTRMPSIAFMFLAALLIIASAWMCVSFRRGYFPSNGSKYQKLETDLPVSGGGKTESDMNDGWDNSWGDSWDDEEAPKTPSKPVTPSLSSKGLASRRYSKEGWKD